MLEFHHFQNYLKVYGELAQLGERFAGSEEVDGSIPLFSTIHNPLKYEFSATFKNYYKVSPILTHNSNTFIDDAVFRGIILLAVTTL